MQIIFITGTPGSGKSTVAEALSQKFKKSAHIQVDFFRKLIKAGYASPHHWNEEVERQYTLARRNAAQTAGNIVEAGFTVIIDDIIRQKWVQEWEEALSEFESKFILLNPELDVAKERNRSRDIWTVDEKIIEDLHRLLRDENKRELGWIIIDNSLSSIDKTVDEILHVLN